MLIVETLPVMRREVRRWRHEGKRIALVPTMGNLHDGHIALVETARQHADIVVVTIFVNPMQFDNADDLIRYPRTLQDDYEKLSHQQVDLVFAPEAQVIYPNDLADQTLVDVPGLSSRLEGASRPGHFRGVTTIVSKLFNLVQPDVALFGEKDFQQLAVIRKMVADMGYDIDIIPVATVRTPQGLALSSRNSRLTSEEKTQAPLLYQLMQEIAADLIAGQRDMESLVARAESVLVAKGWRPDGLAICDAITLLPADNLSQRVVILMAAWLGDTRLIDNMQVELPSI